MDDLISRLSEMRSDYNCFDETEEPYYRALSEAIQLASAQPEQGDEAIFWKKRAREYEDIIADLITAQARGIKLDSIEITEEGITFKKSQPERTGKWIHGRELAREMISDCIVAIRYDGWRCSECDCLVEQERESLYKFCPNCGARMEDSEDIPMEYFENGGK